ncbi:MAG TPA: SRPBCC family protein [Bacteroidia bacterium]
MLIPVIIVIASVIMLPLLIAVFMKKEYHVERSVIINAPKQKVFDYIKLLGNQDHFNKWVMADPDMKKDFRGTDGTKGFIYAWNGNKQAGEGEYEITDIIEGERVSTEIRFVRPMASKAYGDMITESVAADKTKVTWSNTGGLKYPMNLMSSMIGKMLSKDMDTSLNMLKNILEK